MLGKSCAHNIPLRHCLPRTLRVMGSSHPPSPLLDFCAMPLCSWYLFFISCDSRAFLLACWYWHLANTILAGLLHFSFRWFTLWLGHFAILEAYNAHTVSTAQIPNATPWMGEDIWSSRPKECLVPLKQPPFHWHLHRSPQGVTLEVQLPSSRRHSVAPPSIAIHHLVPECKKHRYMDNTTCHF